MLIRSLVAGFSFIALCLWLWIGVGAAMAQEESAGASTAGLDVETIQEFDSLDRNRDGGLNDLEFAFSEIGQRARKHGNRELVDRLYQQIDQNGDGKISLLELVQSQHNRNARILDRASSGKYAGFDTNEDGLIGLDEYLKTPDAKQDAFQAIDLNGNKSVGPVEWVLALREDFMDRETAAVFTQLDSNDDGIIDGGEFKKIDPLDPIAGSFGKIDLNGNREIGPREFAKAQIEPAGGIPPEILAEFEDLDRNEDQAISRREFSRSNFAENIARNIRRVEEVFSILDKNQDGEVSLAEWVAHKTRPGATKKAK